MSKVVGIGANVHDTLIVLPEYPQEDTKLRAASHMSCGGGPCATGLVACSKLGTAAAFIGSVSDDASGTFLVEDFKKYGVETSFIRVEHGYESFVSYVMLSEKNASRTIVFDKGNLPPVQLDAKQKDAIKNASVLMVDGNELDAAVEGAHFAHENGTKVLYDAGGLYKDVERLLPLADILIPSEEFAIGITKADSAENAIKLLFDKYSPEVCVITQGKKGGIMYDGSEIRHYGAYSVEALDSNGAGDVFHGAFAFAVTKGFDYFKACKFSSAVSALKCTKIGARSGVPDYKTTLKFLKERGENGFEKDME